ncbi:MAG: hypothetical protein ACREVE_05780 [Gammaproteobacteria bacterium]
MLSAIWTSKWSPLNPDPYPMLKGAITGLGFGGIIVAVLVASLSVEEISAEQYAWVTAQVKSQPEIRDQVSAYLAEDGRITRGELWALKKQTEPQATEEARAALDRQLSKDRGPSKSQTDREQVERTENQR